MKWKLSSQTNGVDNKMTSQHPNEDIYSDEHHGETQHSNEHLFGDEYLEEMLSKEFGDLLQEEPESQSSSTDSDIVERQDSTDSGKKSWWRKEDKETHDQEGEDEQSTKSMTKEEKKELEKERKKQEKKDKEQMEKQEKQDKEDMKKRKKQEKKDEEEHKKQEEKEHKAEEKARKKEAKEAKKRLNDEEASSVMEATKELRLMCKDALKGGPVAFKKLTDFSSNDGQMQSIFDKLPKEMQKMIKEGSDQVTPELIANATKHVGKTGVDMNKVGKAASTAKKFGIVPDIKTVIGPIVGLGKPLLAAFPMVATGPVLIPLGIILGLLILWYCHKQGRQKRIENELQLMITEAEVNKVDQTPQGLIHSTERMALIEPATAPSMLVHEFGRVEEPPVFHEPAYNELPQLPQPPVEPAESKPRRSFFSRKKSASE